MCKITISRKYVGISWKWCKVKEINQIFEEVLHSHWPLDRVADQPRCRSLSSGSAARQLNCRQPCLVPFRLLPHVPGTTCRPMWHLLSCCPHSASETSVFEIIGGIFPGFLTDFPRHWLTFSSGSGSSFYFLGYFKKSRLVDWLIGSGFVTWSTRYSHTANSYGFRSVFFPLCCRMYSATLVAKTWAGICSAVDWLRLDRFLNGCKRIGFYATDLPSVTVTELCIATLTMHSLRQ